MPSGAKAQTRKRPAPVQGRTQASLPSLVEKAKIPAKWRSHYRRLAGYREELLADASHLLPRANPQNLANGADDAEQGAENSERELSLNLLRSENSTLAEIEAAMRRIEIGTYGRCEKTGLPIADSRLKAIPWTRYTADTERLLEAQRARQQAAGKRQER